MYLQTQSGTKLLNLDLYDRIIVDCDQILAYQGERYIILGEYADTELAMAEFCSIVSVLSRKDRYNVIKMG